MTHHFPFRPTVFCLRTWSSLFVSERLRWESKLDLTCTIHVSHTCPRGPIRGQDGDTPPTHIRQVKETHRTCALVLQTVCVSSCVHVCVCFMFMLTWTLCTAENRKQQTEIRVSLNVCQKNCKTTLQRKKWIECATFPQIYMDFCLFLISECNQGLMRNY